MLRISFQITRARQRSRERRDKSRCSRVRGVRLCAPPILVKFRMSIGWTQIGPSADEAIDAGQVSRESRSPFKVGRLFQAQRYSLLDIAAIRFSGARLDSPRRYRHLPRWRGTVGAAFSSAGNLMMGVWITAAVIAVAAHCAAVVGFMLKNRER